MRGLGNAAILYHPDGFDTEHGRLMGRQSAGAGLLRGLARYARVDRFYCHTQDREHALDFGRRIRAERAQAAIHWVSRGNIAALREAGCLHLADPTLAEHANAREGHGPASFSITGITHTMASHRALDAVVALPSGAIHEWDAVICTSSAIRTAILDLLEAEEDRLRRRIGATRFTRPQLPLIPLGVHCDDFARSDGLRSATRQRLGIAAGHVAFLFAGRLSFHAKANPLPMLLALEHAARQANTRLHLVQAGQFAKPEVADVYRQATAAFCPSVTHHFVDGSVAAQYAGAWACADVFTSLSDNIQETFGLTPLEAMASSLPVVVSDWSGYRDTVRHEVDGFRVPTALPASPVGEELAQRYADGVDSYDRYCGYASQFTSVDIAAAAQAYINLVESPDLRARMGAAAQQRARLQWDWRHVIRQYQELWHELAERRKVGARHSPVPRPVPGRSNPFEHFRGFATRILSAADLVTLSAGFRMEGYDSLRATPLTTFASRVLPADDLCRAVLAQLAPGGAYRIDALARKCAVDPNALVRCAAWLLKVGAIHVVVDTDPDRTLDHAAVGPLAMSA